MRHVFTCRACSLLFLLALLLAFSACGGAADSEGEAATTTPQTQTEAAVAQVWSIGGNTLSDYRIIHENTAVAEECAKRIRLALFEATGVSLTVLPDRVAEQEWEILVGQTNRAQSRTLCAAYDRPNICYDIRVTDGKLVVMGEGMTTLEAAVTRLTDHLAAYPAPHDLSEAVGGGDILATADPLGVSVLERADGTALRLLHWNMAAPYLDPAVTTPPVVYDSNRLRGEVMADLILWMMPDIITTNEFYKSHNGNSTLWDAVMGQLEEYYIWLDSPYDKGKPTDAADAIAGKTVNSNILLRKEANLKVISSAWRYSTEQTTVTAQNPGGFVYYHGFHTAVLEQNGHRFILSTAHYADSRSSDRWAREQLAAIADADGGQQLPVILTGDLYTGYTSTSPDSAYRYLTAQGYLDAQRQAKVNANGILNHGTFHKIGQRQVDRICEDLIFYTDAFEALCFKVLANRISDDTSDHYPVLADLTFTY